MTISSIADAGRFPGLPMALNRLILEPGETSPEQAWDATRERFLYVISGSGRARVGEQEFELGSEDVLWLEPGDGYRLEAAAEELQVLEASVPG